MNLEEIMVKLGLDGTSLSQGVRKLKTELGELREHGHAGFVHMGNAGRAFHKVMERIAEVSPVAASALQAVFSPVTALIVAAGMALEAFNKRMEETRRMQDEQGLLNGKAVSDQYEVQAKVHDHVVSAVEEQSKFQRQLAESHSEVLDSLKAQEKSVENQLKIDEKRLEAHKDLSSYAKEKADLEAKASRDILKAQQHSKRGLESDLSEAQAKERGYYQQYRSSPDFPTMTQSSATAAATKAELERLKQKDAQLLNEIGSLEPGAIGAAARLAQGLRTRAELEKEEEEVAKTMYETQEKYQHQLKPLQELTDRLKVQKDQWDQSREQVQKLSEAVHGLTQKINETKDKLALSLIQPSALRPFLPGMSEFAERRGPIGDLARRVMGTREGIANQLLRGNTAGAEYLRKQLQGYDVPGYDMPDWSQGGKLMPTKTHVKGLEERWSEVLRSIVGENGVPVQIVGLPDDK